MRSCGPNRPTPNELEIGRGLVALPPYKKPLRYVDYVRGQVGSGIASLDAVLADGAVRRLTLHHRWVLYLIASANPPVELVARDAAGKVVATQHVASGACLNRACRNRVKHPGPTTFRLR